MSTDTDLITEARFHGISVGPNMGICAMDGFDAIHGPIAAVLREACELVQRLTVALEAANTREAELREGLADFEARIAPQYAQWHRERDALAAVIEKAKAWNAQFEVDHFGHSDDFCAGERSFTTREARDLDAILSTVDTAAMGGGS